MNEPVTASVASPIRALAATEVVRLLPVAALLVTGVVVTWLTEGAVVPPAFPPEQWLPLAVVAALVLAALLLARAAVLPQRAALLAGGALVGLAGWTALSILWSPVPSGALDEMLLVSFYAVVLAVAVLAPSGARERLLALELATGIPALVAVAVAVDVLWKKRPQPLFFGGRLDFPIAYVNASAALYAIAVWPSLMLAARRRTAPIARALWLGAAALLLATSLACQSKGSLLGLTVATIGVFALVPHRLRLVPPALLVAVVAAAAGRPLTGPFRSRTTDAAFASAAHHEAIAALVVAVVGVVAGLAYATVDSRIAVSERVRRRAGAGLLSLLALCLVAGVAAFFVRVDRPGAWFAARWHSFANAPTAQTGSTHLTSLGSHRIDFWRVAGREFVTHPVAGIGARGFFSAYLQHRRTDETPLRAHSLYLDVLAEEGLVGFALLAVALLLPLVALARRLDRVTAAGAFAASLYLLAHAAVDWIWTFPLLGLELFVYLGIGLVGDDRPLLRPRAAAAGGAVALLLAACVFAPPYLSGRFTKAAYDAGPGSAAAADLRWARRLDPLALEPLFARWRLAATPAAGLAALEDAHRLEPRNVAALFQLGGSYERIGRLSKAHSFYVQAQRLDPRDGAIAAAVRRTRR
jgi:hypothetical protein